MFWGLIGKSRFLDADLEELRLETWAWLMDRLGGMARLDRTVLATPSPDFFPPTQAQGRARASHIFDCVRKHMGMGEWRCSLQPFDRREANARVGEFWFVRSRTAPNGTFQIRDGEVVIRYASDLVDRPGDLVATLAHELSHYLLDSIGEAAPGGEDAWELATEVCVAFTGFGVFGANHAFFFEQHADTFGQGWSSSRNGYLSERTWAFVLALFLTLKGQAGAAEAWLKPSVRSLVKDAERYLRKHEELLAPLRSP